VGDQADKERRLGGGGELQRGKRKKWPGGRRSGEGATREIRRDASLETKGDEKTRRREERTERKAVKYSRKRKPNPGRFLREGKRGPRNPGREDMRGDKLDRPTEAGGNRNIYRGKSKGQAPRREDDSLNSRRKKKDMETGDAIKKMGGRKRRASY